MSTLDWSSNEWPRSPLPLPTGFPTRRRTQYHHIVKYHVTSYRITSQLATTTADSPFQASPQTTTHKQATAAGPWERVSIFSPVFLALSTVIKQRLWLKSNPIRTCT